MIKNKGKPRGVRERDKRKTAKKRGAEGKLTLSSLKDVYCPIPLRELGKWELVTVKREGGEGKERQM